VLGLKQQCPAADGADMQLAAGSLPSGSRLGLDFRCGTYAQGLIR